MLCVSWAPRFFGTVGEKHGFALYSSFPTCFFPSWLFWGESVVFPHGKRQERRRASCHAALPFQPHAAPALWHRSWEVPRGASPFCHHSLPLSSSSSSSLLACVSSAGAAKGHTGGLAPSPAVNAALCRA